MDGVVAAAAEAQAGAVAAAAVSGVGGWRLLLPLHRPHLLVVQGHQGAGLLVARRLPENGRWACVGEGVAHWGLLRSAPGAGGGEGWAVERRLVKASAVRLLQRATGGAPSPQVIRQV